MKICGTPLTEMQERVLLCAMGGLTEAETAVLLERSIHTVRSHRKNVLKRLAARNMAHAAAVYLGIHKLAADLMADLNDGWMEVVA